MEIKHAVFQSFHYLDVVMFVIMFVITIDTFFCTGPLAFPEPKKIGIVAERSKGGPVYDVTPSPPCSSPGTGDEEEESDSKKGEKPPSRCPSVLPFLFQPVQYVLNVQGALQETQTPDRQC